MGGDEFTAAALDDPAVPAAPKCAPFHPRSPAVIGARTLSMQLRHRKQRHQSLTSGRPGWRTAYRCRRSNRRVLPPGCAQPVLQDTFRSTRVECPIRSEQSFLSGSHADTGLMRMLMLTIMMIMMLMLMMSIRLMLTLMITLMIMMLMLMLILMLCLQRSGAP